MPTPHVRSVAEWMQEALRQHELEVWELKEHHSRELHELHRRIEELTTLASGDAGQHSPTAKFEVSQTSVGSEHLAEPDGDYAIEATPTEHHQHPSASQPVGGEGRRRSQLHVLMTTSEDEATEFTRLRRFVTGPFDNIVCLVILLNGIFLFAQQELVGRDRATQAGVIHGGATDASLDSAFFITEHVLNGFLLLEVILRVAVLRRAFFFHEHTRHFELINVFDLVLVVMTSIELYLSSFLGDGVINFNAFRVLRFLRLARIMRIARSMSFLFKLRVLVSTVICSLFALFWSIVLLLTTMLVSALFVSQVASMHQEDSGISFERREWLFRYYGTSTRSYWTLFELTFSGGWPQYARPLVEEVSPWWSLFFFGYIIIVQFAMFRIVTALFLRDTLALAANDAETGVQEKLHMQRVIGDRLLEFFHEADSSKDGMLSLHEFTKMVENPKVRAWLSMLELEVRDAKEAFHLTQLGGDGDGMVSAAEFVKGMMRMKGPALSQDVLTVLQANYLIQSNVSKLAQEVGELRKELRGRQATSFVGPSTSILS